jgi:hypothetical protein
MGNKQEDIIKYWKKFLDPENLKRSLIEASIFITAYEILKDEIIQRIKSFLTLGREHDPEVRAEYKKEMRDLHKSILDASCLWLEQQRAITRRDVELIAEITKHRNVIAHELPKLITLTELEVDRRLLECLNELVTKISRWWVLEVEVPTNSDFDHVDVKEEDVLTGPMMFMGVVMKVFKD